MYAWPLSPPHTIDSAVHKKKMTEFALKRDHLDRFHPKEVRRPIGGGEDTRLLTSSILDPVSVRAVEIIESEPPFSMFLAAPKNRFGLCNAFASTPPERIFPEEGWTPLE